MTNKLNKVTRLEIIDKNGRAYVRWDCEIDQSFQDDGCTLKIFVKETKKENEVPFMVIGNNELEGKSEAEKAWSEAGEAYKEVYRAWLEAREAYKKVDKAWYEANRARDEADEACSEAVKAWSEAVKAYEVICKEIEEEGE